MRGVAALLLLALASCSAPKINEVTVAAPESRCDRILDRLAGERQDQADGDPEAERSLRRHLGDFQNRPFLITVIMMDSSGWDRIIRTDWEQETGAPKVRKWPFKEPDYGLYANPIP